MGIKMVSIIMPAHNAERTVTESVKSVLDQINREWELIIIDDCSSDGTRELCKSFSESDSRVRVLSNKTNRGVAYSRNRGVETARGEWVAFLDSDDVWRKDKLEKQMAFIQENNADISYTASAFMDERGNDIGYILHAEKELTFDRLLRRNLMSCSSVVIRRDLLQKKNFRQGNFMKIMQCG
jgi:glycosyltransferase involved in cell wall biosynthesis